MNHKIFVRSISIYRESNMPTEGWIQSCFKCYILTSRDILFKTYKKNNNVCEINVFLCTSCKNKLKKKVTEYLAFYKKCDKYIIERYWRNSTTS